MLAEQAKKDLATAVGAARQQEHAWQEQQVSAQIQAHMSDVQTKHNAELTMLREKHARQQSTAQSGRTAQLTTMEAELQQLQQRLEQVPYACLLQLMNNTNCFVARHRMPVAPTVTLLLLHLVKVVVTCLRLHGSRPWLHQAETGVAS